MTRQKSANRANIRHLITLPLLLTAIIIFSCEGEKEEQTETSTNSEEPSEHEPDSQDLPGETIYVTAEKMPSFNNSDFSAFRQFVQENLSYPEEARVKGIEGRVFVQFVVSSEGYVKNVKVIQGIHPLLDAEAVRVIQSSPQWTPGENRGERVAVRLTMPVDFNL